MYDKQPEAATIRSNQSKRSGPELTKLTTNSSEIKTLSY